MTDWMTTVPQPTDLMREYPEAARAFRSLVMSMFPNIDGVILATDADINALADAAAEALLADLQEAKDALGEAMEDRFALLVALAVRRWYTIPAPGAAVWNAMCWSPELGLMVCTSEASATPGVDDIMVSKDAVHWDLHSTGLGLAVFGITWSAQAGVFVAVASSGTGQRVMTSPDGLVWTLRTTPVDNNWRGVAWSQPLSMFAAVSATGAGNCVMTSPDGIIWTSRTTPGGVTGWRRVVWAEGLGMFVAVTPDNAGNQVMTSADGITWTLRTTPGTGSYHGIAWSQHLGLLVAVGGSVTMVSSDGVNWEEHTLPTSGVLNVAWSPTLLVFAAVAPATTGGERIMTSKDGVSWRIRTYESSVVHRDIIWAEGPGVFAVSGAIGAVEERMAISGQLE